MTDPTPLSKHHQRTRTKGVQPVVLKLTRGIIKPFLPGPPVLRGLMAGLAENFATWPLAQLIDRHHPARGDMPDLSGNRRALAQATWRHALFGVVMGALEHALNDRSADEPPPIPYSSNGHGSLEAAVSVAEA